MTIMAGDIDTCPFCRRTGKGGEGTPEHDIYIGISGVVYDVTKGRLFYGPGTRIRICINRQIRRSRSLFSLFLIIINK